MKPKKLKFENFKKNQLERKQIVSILGGAPTPKLLEYVDPIVPIGPVNPDSGSTSTNPGDAKISLP
jgi:hypothetical protein